MSDPDIISEFSAILLTQAMEAEQVTLEALQLSNVETRFVQQEAVSLESHTRTFEASVAAYTEAIEHAGQTFEHEVARQQTDQGEDTRDLIEKVEALKNSLLGENKSSPAPKNKKPGTSSKNKS